MIQSAAYICDKCGLKTTYLPMVFPEDYESRLCVPCMRLFKEQYRLWCNDPKPALDPEPKGFFSRFLDWI